MSTSITTWDALVPGSVVLIDAGSRSAEWVRVTATAGVGPFTSEVRALGRWERWRLVVGAGMRRARSLWLRRVWWPVSDWVEDRWTEWRQR